MCSPIPDHILLLAAFNQNRADAQDPSNHFISNITLGFRRAVFCYRITAWWSLAGTSGDWLVQYHSSKQGQQKQLFGSALHNLSGQPVHSSATATVKKKRKIRCWNIFSCAQFVPFASSSAHHWRDPGSVFSSPMKCFYALIKSLLLYNPSSLTLCSHITNAPRRGPPSMPTRLLHWEAQQSQVCTHSPSPQCCWPSLLQGHDWPVHSPGPPGLF